MLASLLKRSLVVSIMKTEFFFTFYRSVPIFYFFACGLYFLYVCIILLDDDKIYNRTKSITESKQEKKWTWCTGNILSERCWKHEYAAERVHTKVATTSKASLPITAGFYTCYIKLNQKASYLKKKSQIFKKNVFVERTIHF